MAKNTPHVFKAGGRLISDEKTFWQSPYYAASYDFPYNPDSLCAGNNYNTYDEMRHDDQVKAALSMKKDMAIGTGWQIKSDKEEVREFIEGNLKGLNATGLAPSFEEVLRDMLSAYDYGFSLSEVVYALGEDNLYRVSSIKVRPPHSFRFDMDEKGNVKTVIQSVSRGGELKFDPDIFLHFAYQMEFGNPYGISDLKSAHIPWKIKKYGFRFYAKYLERFVSPIVHGSYDPIGGATDSNAIYDILTTIQNSTVLVTPKNVEVAFIQPGKDGADVYEKAINQLDLKIARGILMPDLMGLSGGQTDGGAYALGKKQFELFLATIKKDRELLSKKITHKVIKPLVAANWGDVEAEFCFLPYSEGDEIELAKLWISAIQTGAFKPNAEEVNQLRKISKFPEGEVEMADPAQGAPAPKEDGKGLRGAPGSDSAGDEEGAGANEVKEEGKADMTEKHFRALSSYEKKVDFKEIKNILDSSEARAVPKIRKAALKIANSLMAQIEDKKIMENWKPESMNSIKPKFLKEMNFIFRNHFQDLFEASIKEAQREILPEKTYIDAELLPEEFLTVIEEESFKAVGDYAADILKRAQNILSAGLKNGIPTSQIHREIRAAFDEFTDRWVNTVVRTKTTEVYNAARKIYYETDPIASQIVTGYVYSAIMDDRTSKVCEFLDGRSFEAGDFVDRITPPLHFNCRSLLVPVTKFEEAKFETPPSIQKLQDMGANLIYTENK